MNHIDVMKQALAALEHAEKDVADYGRLNYDQTGDAITTLREALAAPQPVQQAVQLDRDAIAVNLLRLAGLDKHKARECAEIVMQVLAEAARQAQKPGFYTDLVGTTPAVDGDAVALVVTQSLDDISAAPSNQLDDINVADMAAPNSVEIDGIKTEPEKQEPDLWPVTADAIRQFVGSDFCSLKFGREDEAPDENDQYIMSAHDLISAFRCWKDFELQPAQQDPDALHLAAMDLARKQADRIAELEVEVTRFRAAAMNEKSVRQALEQQLEALKPSAEYQRIGTLYSESWPITECGWRFALGDLKCTGYAVERDVFVIGDK